MQEQCTCAALWTARAWQRRTKVPRSLLEARTFVHQLGFPGRLRTHGRVTKRGDPRLRRFGEQMPSLSARECATQWQQKRTPRVQKARAPA